MIEMMPSVTLVVIAAALISVGVYLVLERSLSRVLIGLLILGNGINLIFLIAGGRAGRPPIVGDAEVTDMSDPLPQAMVLTAIVIAMGMAAFLLAMAYRSWQMHRHDEVQDDVEDRRIAQLAARDERAFTDTDTEVGPDSLAEDAAATRDETHRDDVHGVDEGAEQGAMPPSESTPNAAPGTANSDEVQR